MQLHHRLHGEVVKYLNRGTASHLYSYLQQFSGIDSLGTATTNVPTTTVP
jgi:hypothetical protein